MNEFKNNCCGLFLILTLLTTGLTSNAQSWITLGQTWEYFNQGGGTYPGLFRYLYSKDTLYHGKLCQKIDIYVRDFTYTAQQTWTVGENHFLSSRYTYNSGDSVFYYKFGIDSFYLMFDLGAQPGDSWRLFEVEINDWDGCDSSYVVVDSIGTTSINGDTLRWISVHPTGGGNTAIYGKVIEDFGAINHFFLFQGFDCTDNFDFPVLKPLCYDSPKWGIYPEINSQQMPYPFDGPMCNFYEEFIISGLEKINPELQVSVFPQPADQRLTIKLNDNSQCDFFIYDLQGKPLKQGSFTSTEFTFDVSDLLPGLYFIQMQQNHKILNRKVIIH